ncbi:MAG: glycosyltransferase [Planctomycetes bacterium]|nr:glycosyltransferase [Planctomycetota bacterium]
MNLSIIIPVFNEGRKIASDVKEAIAFLNKNNFTGEIIVVDDGSSDNTANTARETAKNLSTEILFKVISYENNKGKGHAVRTGITQSKGDYVMFIDSGSCTTYENILDGLKLIENGDCDIAHGSRKLPHSKIKLKQSLYRRLCAVIFRLCVSYFVKITSNLTDTQCGFKIYRGDIARKLYSQCETDGFIFDIEIILLAQKANFKIKEFPIEWTCDRDSRLRPEKSFHHIISELKTIKQKFT